MNTRRVVVAMSGGVDSSVCAYLLKERGWDVIGVTIKTWSNDECKDEKSKGCCSLRDIADARAVARSLDIPYYVLDLSADFKGRVIDYFVDEYLAGRTPNPCIECNNHIKFGVLAEKARELEAGMIATGHYARMGETPDGTRFIREGADLSKDQSYVLFGLGQEQLQRTMLPIGELSKKEVRSIAERMGLRVHDKPDSQEICFVSGHYKDFVKKHSPDRLPGEGDIVTGDGKVVGRHEGSHTFTVGQRKRLRLPEPSPYFVTGLRPETNEVVVGTEDELLTEEMVVRRVNWQRAPRLGAISVKIRSRHSKTAAQIVSFDAHEVRVRFKEAQKAVAPGQAAVFYEGDGVVGGGWIHSAFAKIEVAA